MKDFIVFPRQTCINMYMKKINMMVNTEQHWDLPGCDIMDASAAKHSNASAVELLGVVPLSQ